jgi:hypothetical protein
MGSGVFSMRNLLCEVVKACSARPVKSMPDFPAVREAPIPWDGELCRRLCVGLHHAGRRCRGRDVDEHTA